MDERENQIELQRALDTVFERIVLGLKWYLKGEYNGYVKTIKNAIENGIISPEELKKDYIERINFYGDMGINVNIDSSKEMIEKIFNIFTADLSRMSLHINSPSRIIRKIVKARLENGE